MGYRVASVPLMPLLYFQGRRVRRETLRLPEPPGARTDIRWADTTDDCAPASAAAPLRLLVLGDSAAAGVGASRQEDALLGQLVADLVPSGLVTWRLVARTGATAASTRRHLAAQPPEQCDVAVVSVGLNDVVAGRGIAEVLSDLDAIIEILQREWGARHVLLSGMPPIGRFPALPQPLRWYLGRRARALDTALAAWVTGRPGCELLPMTFGFDVADMAADGFHPGPAMYTVWARALAARVRAWKER